MRVVLDTNLLVSALLTAAACPSDSLEVFEYTDALIGQPNAALAIEAGCEWITTDRDYARFAGLKWRPPL